MELRHYLRILQRSWPLVAGLPLLVALLTLGVALAAAPRYVLTASILVTQRPIPTGGAPTILPNQDNWNSHAAMSPANSRVLTSWGISSTIYSEAAQLFQLS